MGEPFLDSGSKNWQTITWNIYETWTFEHQVDT